MVSLDRYYPERYRATRSFAKQVAILHRPYSRSTYECAQAINDCVLNTYNDLIMELPREKRPRNLQLAMKEVSLASFYGAFCANGKNIFHFSDGIVQAFRKTDVDEITFENLRFPKENFYFSFGKQIDLELSPGDFVDGAYVIAFSSAMQIILTTIRDDYVPKRFNWVLKRDKYYSLVLDFNDSHQRLCDVVDVAIEKKLKDHDDELAYSPAVMDFEGITVVNRRPESSKQEIHEISTGFPVFREALRLVINGLCYLSAYPQDIESRYSDDAPPDLVKQLKADKPKQRQRAASKLTELGYVLINFCGRAFDSAQQDSTGAEQSGREVRPHLRRGHWRNQPCGVGRSERRLVWIMPAVVHRDRAEGKVLGHIYIVDPPQGE